MSDQMIKMCGARPLAAAKAWMTVGADKRGFGNVARATVEFCK